jgi:hypothetical protein
MSITEDRSTGIKRWFALMTPMLVVAAIIPAATTPTSVPSIAFDIGLTCLFLFLVFCTFVFQADPIGPSRRVLVHWDRQKTGWLARFFGPGLMKTTTFLLVLGLSALAVVALTGVAVAAFSPHVVTADRNLEVERTVFYLMYAATYFLFLGGFAAWVRSKSSTSGIARLMLVVAIFFTAIVPWIIAAIAGILADHRSSDAIIVAAPSPFYVFVLMDALNGASRQSAAAAGIVSSAAWAFIGMGLFAAASSRCKAIVDKHNGLLAQADAMLQKEDDDALEAEKHATEASQAPA